MASTVPRTDHGGTGELIWSRGGPANRAVRTAARLGRTPRARDDHAAWHHGLALAAWAAIVMCRRMRCRRPVLPDMLRIRVRQV